MLYLWKFLSAVFSGKSCIPVTAYVVSNVKELPEKGAKIIGQINENIEAIVIENTNYYYKVTFTDEHGETKEGYVAKRNLKLLKRKRKKMIQKKRTLCLSNKGAIISENVKKKYLCCKNSMCFLSAIFCVYSFFIGKRTI